MVKNFESDKKGNETYKKYLHIMNERYPFSRSYVLVT